MCAPRSTRSTSACTRGVTDDAVGFTTRSTRTAANPTLWRVPAPRRRTHCAALDREIVECRACPRLVEWREQVAVEKRASFRDDTYWGRPVPSFGDPEARVLVAGLAPAAHGANRTGRVFTGDRSGDFLYALAVPHRLRQPADLGVAPTTASSCATSYVTAAVRCAPPANKPTPEERDTCLPYLVRELDLLDRVRVIVVLGAFAYDAIGAGAERGRRTAADAPAQVHPRPRGADRRVVVLGCFHPSQQNTFTGKLTEPMIDDVFLRARALADAVPSRP